MANRFEGAFHSFDQTEIFYQLWSTEAPRGTIVLTHGLAEHSDCYHQLAKLLNKSGWNVYGWDLRGHGRSEGKRGFAMGFDEFCSDFRSFLHHLKTEDVLSGRPVISFSHSMGGLITLRSLLDWPDHPFKAICLSSPLLGIAVDVPLIKDQISRLALKWIPSLTLHNEIKYSDLSRDEAMVKSYEHDVLRHDKISPGIYLGMTESFDLVKEGLLKLNIPLLMQLAGRDRIVSTPAAQDIFAHWPCEKKVLHIYPDSFHEIYNDLDRDWAFTDLSKFINPFLGEK